MKIPVYIASISIPLLVLWLFYSSSIKRERDREVGSLERLRYELDIRKEDRYDKSLALEEKHSLDSASKIPNYTIVKPDGEYMFLLDRNSGVAWRWFETRRDGELHSNGWINTDFLLSGDHYDPSEYIERMKWLNDSQGGSQPKRASQSEPQR